MNYKYIEHKDDPAIQGIILKERKDKILVDTTEGTFWLSKKEFKKDWILKYKIKK